MTKALLNAVAQNGVAQHAEDDAIDRAKYTSNG